MSSRLPKHSDQRDRDYEATDQPTKRPALRHPELPPRCIRHRPAPQRFVFSPVQFHLASLFDMQCPSPSLRGVKPFRACPSNPPPWYSGAAFLSAGAPRTARTDLLAPGFLMPRLLPCTRGPGRTAPSPPAWTSRLAPGCVQKSVYMLRTTARNRAPTCWRSCFRCGQKTCRCRSSRTERDSPAGAAWG